MLNFICAGVDTVLIDAETVVTVLFETVDSLSFSFKFKFFISFVMVLFIFLFVNRDE